MENNPATIIIITVVLFLLYLKFGTMAFWVIAVLGVLSILSLVFVTLFLQVFFFNFYETKFCPGMKKITKRNFDMTILSESERNKFKKLIILFGFVVLALIGLYKLDT